MSNRDLAALEQTRKQLISNQMRLRDNDYQRQTVERTAAVLNEQRESLLRDYRDAVFHLLLTLPHRQFCRLLEVR